MKRKYDSIFNNRYNMNNIENKGMLVSLDVIEDKVGSPDNEMNLLYNKINELILLSGIKKITKSKYREVYYYLFNSIKNSDYNILFNDLEIFVAICSLIGVSYLKMLLVLDSDDVVNIFKCFKHFNWDGICKVLF